MIQLEKRIIALTGLPLTGKTTLGERLVQKTDALFFDVDRARQELKRGNDWLGSDREREIMLEAYQFNHEKAEAALKTGRAVILAATYSRPTYHEMLERLSSDEHVPLDVFLLALPQEEAEIRIAKRVAEGSDSNIRSLEGYLEVRDRYEGFPGAPLRLMLPRQQKS